MRLQLKADNFIKVTIFNNQIKYSVLYSNYYPFFTITSRRFLMSNLTVSNPEILFVDDSKTVRRLARKILSEKYSVHICADGDEAWAKLRATLSIKIVFTDIQMQGMDGTQLLKNIRESTNSRIAAMPVIMITGALDTEAKMRDVFELGATDFIAKPFKSMDLLSRAYSYIKLSDQVNSLEQQLGLDKLTGLANKVSMKQHAVKFLASAHRRHTPFSILFLDVEAFDGIVEKHGNRIASQILSAVSNRLKLKVRDEDVACRTDTSRFAILLPTCSSAQAQISAKRLISDIHKVSFKLGGEPLHINIVAGLTSTDLNDSKVSIDGILSQANGLVMEALNDKSRSFIIHDEAMNTGRLKEEMEKVALVESINHIVAGKYNKVPTDHIVLLRKKMTAFFASCAKNQVKY